MKKTSLKLNKKALWQICLTISTFILTVILPIFGYIQFNKISSMNQLDLGNLQIRYSYVFSTLAITGIFLTILRGSSLKIPQYSMKKRWLNLGNSVLFLAFLSIMAQLGIIDIVMQNFTIYLNLIGVFILLILTWSLFIIKNLYDLYDYKKNR